jgi:predicted thioesterase
MPEGFKRELLPDTRTCYRYLQVGFAVIVATFVAAVVVLAAPALVPTFEVLVMPALFIGLGLLLFGVGTHLHIMHLNALEMRGDDGGHG